MDGSLLEKTKLEKREIDPALVKFIIYGFFYLAAGVWLSYSTLLFLLDYSLRNGILFASALTSFMAFFSLLPLFVNNWAKLINMMVLGLAAIASFFYNQLFKNPEMFLTGLILLFLFFLYAVLSQRKEYNNMLNIKPRRLIKIFISKILGGFLFIVLMIFYLNTITPAKFVIDKTQFDSFVNFFAKTTGFFWPGVNFKIPVSDIFSGISGILFSFNPAFEKLPAAVQSSLIKETAAGSVNSISSFLRIKINPQTNVPEILYQILKENFDLLDQQFKFAIYAFVLVFLFFILKNLIRPFIWLIAFLTFLLYEFLISVSFISVIYESRSKEIVVL